MWFRSNLKPNNQPALKGNGHGVVECEIKPQEICVLHLSDLHFEFGKYKRVHSEMIRDIKSQIEKAHCLIIVVSGDLATGGKVKKVHDLVLNFFREIKKNIPEKCKLLDVEIVPGNHDEIRPAKNTDFNQKTYIGNLSDYDKLQDEIYALFPCTEERQSSSCVSAVEYHGKKIVFARLNTASLDSVFGLKMQVYEDCTGKKYDAAHFEKELESIDVQTKQQAEMLIKSREAALKKCFAEQTQNISTQFNDVVGNEDPALVIAVAHHPLSWLRNTGYEDYYDVLFKYGLTYVDVWMCGHMHDAQAYYISENNRHKVMLMSGVGRQDRPTTEVRYSIYRISLERNTCLVTIRSTQDGTKFSDYVLKGFADEVEEFGGITFPIKADGVGSVIHAESINGVPCRGIFVDKKILQNVPRISEAIQRFRDDLRDKILGYEAIFIGKSCGKIKLDTLLKWQTQSTRGMETGEASKIRKTLFKFCLQIKVFGDFLKCVNNGLVAMFSDLTAKYGPENGVKPVSDIVWRVHSRLYKGLQHEEYSQENDSYCSIFSYQSDAKGILVKRPRDMDWNSFIQSAYAFKHGIVIESSVPGENQVETDWSDFMTIVPSFKGSRLELHRNHMASENRPLLTFGVSFKGKNFEGVRLASRLEYAFAYLDINTTISECFEELTDRFFLDLKYLKKELVPCLQD